MDTDLGSRDESQDERRTTACARVIRSPTTRFRYVLLDGRSRLPAADYSQVRLDLAIGDDEGAADMTLVAGRRGTWFLP